MHVSIIHLSPSQIIPQFYFLPYLLFHPLLVLPLPDRIGLTGWCHHQILICIPSDTLRCCTQDGSRSFFLSPSSSSFSDFKNKIDFSGPLSLLHDLKLPSSRSRFFFFSFTRRERKNKTHKHTLRFASPLYLHTLFPICTNFVFFSFPFTLSRPRHRHLEKITGQSELLSYLSPG